MQLGIEFHHLSTHSTDTQGLLLETEQDQATLLYPKKELILEFGDLVCNLSVLVTSRFSCDASLSQHFLITYLNTRAQNQMICPNFVTYHTPLLKIYTLRSMPNSWFAMLI
jgi:hypothetical protein